MNYLELVPEAPLNNLINKVWWLSYPSIHKQEKILPLPAHHFIINLSKEPYRVIRQGNQSVEWSYGNGFVSGIQSQFLIIENPPQIQHVGVELKPYALGAFTAVAINQIIDTVQDSEILLPGSQKLAKELRDMDNPNDQMQALLGFMTKSMRKDYTVPSLIEPSLPLLEETNLVGEAARRLGVSHKHLTTQWRKYCGVTPKVYINIVRLQQVVAAFARAGESVRWSDVSSELSYTDQPHFIHAFRQLTGFSPKEYANMMNKYPSGDQSFVALDDIYTKDKPQVMV